MFKSDHLTVGVKFLICNRQYQGLFVHHNLDVALSGMAAIYSELSFLYAREWTTPIYSEVRLFYTVHSNSNEKSSLDDAGTAGLS